MLKKITQKNAPIPAKRWILFALFLVMVFGFAGIFLSLLWGDGKSGLKTAQAPVFSSRGNVNVPAPTAPTATTPKTVPAALPAAETANEKTLPPTAEPEKILEPPMTIAPMLDLKVPFGVQAPFGSWDLPYEEACEEASSIMAAAFFQKESLNKDAMNDEILKLVQWQKSYFGYYEDTTAAETAQILGVYFGLEAEVTDEVTVERIKRELNLGHLVIIPASGRALENPHFSGTDPFYHMLLLRGYDDQGHFIANDPGTRRGEGFKYTYENILFANHDWTGSKDTIDTGAKRMIVVKGLE